MKMKIDGERIFIRKLKYSDAKDLYENIKDKEIVKWTANIPYPYPKDGAVKFIRKTHYREKKKKGYAFAIILKEQNKLIGGIDLISINWKNKNAELGYWLGKKYWNKGLMTEAIKLILKFAFKQLKLHKVHASIFEKNIGSQKVLEKSGFKLEGKFKEARFKHNKWQNELKYGILAKEFNN